MDDFTTGYVQAAVLAYAGAGATGTTAKFQAQAATDCAAFQSANAAALATFYAGTGRGVDHAGVDFFTTRQRFARAFAICGAGHGGEELATAAEAYPAQTLGVVGNLVELED